ncbi:MAG: DNA-directed polymerase subunit alpha [Planctomycetota bacterium]|jgi:DNA-directed RNA polymerase subunit alpha
MKGMMTKEVSAKDMFSDEANSSSRGSVTRIRLSKADEEARTLRERLELSTAEIGLCVRTTNCLEEKGIFTVKDLLNSTPDTLLSITNFGEKTLLEVYQALERIGFRRPKANRTLGVFSSNSAS